MSPVRRLGALASFAGVAALALASTGCGTTSVRAVMLDHPRKPTRDVVVLPGNAMPPGFHVLAVLEGDGAHSIFYEESIVDAFAQKAAELGCTHVVAADEHRNYEGTGRERLQRSGEALCGIVIDDGP